MAQFTTEQMDGKLFTYTTSPNRCKVSFYLPDGSLTNYIHIDNQVSFRDLNFKQIKLILGLNFLFTSVNGCVITSSEIIFLTHPSLTFTSKYAEKRGGGIPLSSSSHSVLCCSSCKSTSSCNNTSNNTSTVIKNLEEEFQDSNLYLELVEIPNIVLTNIS